MIVDFFLFEKVSVTLLRQRCVKDQSRDLFFRMKDGKGSVRLSPQDWDAINQHYVESVRPTAKALRWSIYLTFPFSIAVAAILWNVAPLRWVLDHIDDRANFVLWVIITTFLPVAAMIRHSIKVRAAIDRIEEELAPQPRFDPPHARPAGLNILEILALIVVGPHILFGIYGSIDPGAYLNTPLSGTHLDLQAMIGLCVLAGLGFYRWRGGRRWRRNGFDPDPSRRVDPLARAREADA